MVLHAMTLILTFRDRYCPSADVTLRGETVTMEDEVMFTTKICRYSISFKCSDLCDYYDNKLDVFRYKNLIEPDTVCDHLGYGIAESINQFKI